MINLHSFGYTFTYHYDKYFKTKTPTTGSINQITPGHFNFAWYIELKIKVESFWYFFQSYTLCIITYIQKLCQ